MTAAGTDATPFTIAQFVLMAAFALLVIAGMLYGRRLKHKRVKAAEEIEEHRDAVVDRQDDVPAQQDEPETVSTAEPAAASIAPAPLPVADTPVVAAPPATTTAAAPLAGDIRQLKGLGPKLAATLADLGITRVDQIAAMSPDDLAALDARLGTFKGRPARDRWAEQARLLAAGDRQAYEAEFGKLGG